MDEPLSSLDAKLREDLRIELKRIQRELGATILYVTHDQIEAMTMADRIGVIEDGRLLQLASPREVYGRPGERRRRPPPGLAADQPAADGRAAGARRPAPPRPWACARRTCSLGDERHRGADRAGRAAWAPRPSCCCRLPGARLHALMPGLARVEAGTATRVAVPPEAMLFFAADGRRLAA